MRSNVYPKDQSLFPPWSNFTHLVLCQPDTLREGDIVPCSVALETLTPVPTLDLTVLSKHFERIVAECASELELYELSSAKSNG